MCCRVRAYDVMRVMLLVMIIERHTCIACGTHLNLYLVVLAVCVESVLCCVNCVLYIVVFYR